MSSSEDYKARVKRQLQHYAPEKAPQADALLAKYSGKEDKLLAALVKQYGPEPSSGGGAAANASNTSSSASPTGGGGGGGDVKSRIKAQLQKYAPDKAPQADALIAKYSGKEEKLLEALVKQYGPEPSSSSSGGAGGGGTAATPKTQSPAPASSSVGGGGDVKARIKAQLQKYAPEKAPQADALIAKYSGKEDKLLEALVKQYGPEPSSSAAAAPKTQSPAPATAPTSSSTTSGSGDIKSRIKAQLQKYAPEKAPQADALIAKYSGKEDKLLEALVKQYGPEPSSSSSASVSAPSASNNQQKSTPPAASSSSPPPPSTGASSSSSGDVKSRIKAQLQKYAPEKAPQADALIAKYAGKEEKLLEALVKQYGPEPPSASAPQQQQQQAPTAPPSSSTPKTQTPTPPPVSSSSSSGAGDIKSRIKAQLQKYAPEKAPQADALIAKYSGKEEKLLEALVKQYGPEPSVGAGDNTKPPAGAYTAPPLTSSPSSGQPQQQQQQQQQQKPTSPPSSSTPAAGAGDIKSRIKAQLQKYAPEKAPQADALIAKYSGKEEKLLEALVKQYGPEPSSSSSAAVSAPSSPTLPPAAAASPSTQSPIPASNQQQQQQSSSSGDIKSRIRAQLQKYAPDKAPQADALIAKYSGKEEKLLEALVKQYGPEPSSSTSSPVPNQLQQQPASSVSSPTTQQQQQQSSSGTLDIKSRIKAQLQKYAPEKAPQADALITKYAGKEEKLLEALVKQYGPEPSVTSAFSSSSPSSPTTTAAGAGDDTKPPAGSSSYTAPPLTSSSSSPSSPTSATTTSSSKDIPTRIKELLQHYAPEKASQSNALLAKYSGKEETLLEQLIKQFGPEPGTAEFINKQQQQQRQQQAASSNSRSGSPTTTAKSSSTTTNDPSQQEELVKRIRNLIGYYAPEKLQNLEVLLEKYKGKEQQLIDVLVSQYGPEPRDPAAIPPPAGSLGAAAAASSSMNRSTSSGADQQQQQQQAPASPTTTALSSSASMAPIPTSSLSVPERIKNLVSKYDPKKEEQVPQLLKKFSGQEQKLLDALVRQYGPEDEFVGNAQPSSQSPSTTMTMTIESLPKPERIRRLVKHYAPDRDDNQINALLAKSAGQEDRLLQALTKQYGPEPPVTSTSSTAASPVGSPSSPSSGNQVSFEQQQIRDEITSLVREKDPSRINRIPALFTRYHGEEGRLLGMLQLRYMSADQGEDQELIPFPSAEPPPQPASIPTTNDAQASIRAAEQKAALRNQLREIFTKSAPHKLNDVERMTDAFYDEPERILSVMRERYTNSDGTPVAPPPTSASSQQQQQQSPSGSPSSGSPVGQRPHSSSTSGSPGRSFNPADAKRVIYLRLESLFRTYCPQKLHETSSVLDAWEHASGYPSSMFKALYTELRVPPEDQTFHSGLEAVLSGGHVDPSSILSRRGARRNTILGQAGGVVSAGQRMASNTPSDAEGVGLAPPASPGTITSKGKLLLRFVAGRSVLHRDQDGSLRQPDDPNAALKSPSSVWCNVMYPSGHEVYRSPKMIIDIEGNGEWEEDKTNLCALLVTPGESPLLSLVVYNDAGFFLGELRLNLQRLPHKSQHSFTLRPRVEERDSTILSTAARNNGTGLGELEIKWSFNQDRSGASGAGIGNTLGITKDGDTVGNTKESLDQMQQQLSSVKAPVNPIRPRIRAFFARFIPEHLHEVPAVLEEYRGRETELLDALCVRFGPEPDPMAFQTRIERIFCDYDPGRVPEARQIAQKSVGKEEFVIRTLVKKYGQEPAPNYSLPPVGGTAPHPPSDPSRIRLTRWLMLRLPRRVSEIEYLLTRFEGRENVMFRLLAQTTGPEPTDDPPKSSLRSTKIPTPALREYFAKRQAPLFLRWVWNGETQDGGRSNQKVTPFHSKFDQYKARLEAFYAHYNPIKMQEVEETLRRWRGREDILFEALVHKYGAEPTAIHGGGSKSNNSFNSFGGGGAGNSGSPTLAKQQQAALDPTRPLGSTPRAVLQSFYAVHNPSKLPDVDRLIERFAGREASLFSLLESKYGVNLDGGGNSSSSPLSGSRAGFLHNNNNNSPDKQQQRSLDDTFSTPQRERVIRRPPGMFGGSPSTSRSPSRGVSYQHQHQQQNYNNNGLDSDEEQTGFSIPRVNNISSIAGQRMANARAGSNSPNNTSSYTQNFSFNPNYNNNNNQNNGGNSDFRSVSFADRSEL